MTDPQTETEVGDVHRWSKIISEEEGNRRTDYPDHGVVGGNGRDERQMNTFVNDKICERHRKKKDQPGSDYV